MNSDDDNFEDLPEFSDYFMQVEVHPQRGLYFVSQKQNIDYHSHVQHVLGILGAPDKIFEHRAGEERKGEKKVGLRSFRSHSHDKELQSPTKSEAEIV